MVLCVELWICKFASQLLPKGILKAWFLQEPLSGERRADEWLIFSFLISDAYVHKIWKWIFLSFWTSVEYILNWLLDSEVTGEGRSGITYSILAEESRLSTAIFRLWSVHRWQLLEADLQRRLLQYLPETGLGIISLKLHISSAAFWQEEQHALLMCLWLLLLAGIVVAFFKVNISFTMPKALRIFRGRSGCYKSSQKY